jgi:predicted  nucleic acid-binding Zn-ribbon protein
MSLTPISAGSLEALLALQAIDTDLDRHHHRRATLPERAELVAVDNELAAVEQRLAAARAARDAVAGEQLALERTLATVEARAAEVKKRLYGGTVSATRELQAMAAELDSLTARASQLESRVLEVMGEWDPLDDGVTAIEADKAARAAARAQLEEALAAGEAEVDAEIAILDSARTEAATHVPADLAKTYEQLRLHLGGVGAARLVGARCGGCYLTLPATELDRLRHQGEDTLSFCEQCGRILVPANRGL